MAARLTLGQPNLDAVDAWTPVHALSGAAFAAFGVSLGWTLALGAAYELAEYSIESPRGSAIFGSKRPESGVNVVIDLAVMAAGWGIARMLL